ncbi:MAG: CYTH domain-containing protein [Bacteroidales bacterium]|nr:CYTH domain-containing protein [Bacteroidales bacterium]
MAFEIERKFLVKGEFKHLALSSNYIVQGYLCADKNKSVRVRLRGDKGYITIKASTENSKIIRNEWEYEIPAPQVNEMLRLCASGIIEKTRYIVQYKNLVVEVDEFYGDNEGLVIAEIELAYEHQMFEKPDFLGEDVTEDPRYLNSELSKHPYCEWKDTCNS